MAVTCFDSLAWSGTAIVFYDLSATTWTARTLTGADLFPDNAAVGDYIVFGTPWRSKDILISISTPLACTSITVVWEHLAFSGWVAMPNVVDGTNAFRNSGSQRVIFDPMDSQQPGAPSGSGLSGNKSFIRCRITAINSITEGGAFNAAPTSVQNMIVVDGYSAVTPCRLSDIYTAEIAGTRLLAPAMTCTTGMTICNIRPCEEGSQQLIFTLSGTSAGAGDTLDLTGTGANGQAQIESISVAGGDGTYASLYSYKTLTSYNCTGWADGTVSVSQGRWGGMWRLTSISDLVTNARSYFLDRMGLQVKATGYFKMTQETLDCNTHGYYTTSSIDLAENITLDRACVSVDDRLNDTYSNAINIYYEFDIGGAGSGDRGLDIDHSIIRQTKYRGIGWNQARLQGTSNDSMTYTFLNNPGCQLNLTSLPTMSRNIILCSSIWYQANQEYLDYGNSFMNGTLYLITGGALTVKDYIVGAVDDQYQANQTYFLKGITSDSWPTAITTNSYMFRFNKLDVKVVDELGNPVSGATVRIQDSNGADTHCTTYQVITVQHAAGTKYVDVDEGDTFVVGDTIEINYPSMLSYQTRTITTISLNGGYGGSDRLNFASGLTYAVPKGSRVARSGNYLQTNATGDILTQWIIYTKTEAAVTTYAPHTITVSKTGYVTESLKVTIDEARKITIKLEPQVKFITAGGDPLLWNLAPTNSQNKHKWAKV